MLTAEDPTSLQGKRVVVAGGSSGIGRAIAIRLVREGARVLVFGRNEATLNEGLADIRGEIASGGEVHGVVGDNANHEDIARAFAEADAKLGGLDILVGVAGVGIEGVVDSSPEEIEYAVRANVAGYLFDAHEAMKRMRPQGSGHILFIGSLSAVSLAPGGDVYAATKAANQAFVASFRKSAYKDGVRVSIVEPGLIGTDMQEDIPPAKQREMEADDLMLKAEDVAAAVLYVLVQPSRAHVTDLRIRPTMQEA